MKAMDALQVIEELLDVCRPGFTWAKPCGAVKRAVPADLVGLAPTLVALAVVVQVQCGYNVVVS